MASYQEGFEQAGFITTSIKLVDECRVYPVAPEPRSSEDHCHG